MDSETLDTLFHLNIRLDKIIWLAGAACGFTDEDFFEDLCDLDVRAHPSMAPLLECPAVILEDEEEWLAWTSRKNLFGFVVVAATPVPFNVRPDGSYSTNGWGYYATKMMYVSSPDEAVPLAIEWQESLVKAARAKEAKAI